MYTEHQPRLQLSVNRRRVPRPCSGGTCDLAGKVTVSRTTGEGGKGTHGGGARAQLVCCGNPSRKGSGGAEVIPRGSTRGQGSARPSEDGRDGEGTRPRRPEQREQRGRLKRDARSKQQRGEAAGRKPAGRPLAPGCPGVSAGRSRGDRTQRRRGSPFTPPSSLVFPDRVTSASSQAILGEFRHPERETSSPRERSPLATHQPPEP